ncbi:MAG: hypothetical protein AAB527_02405 [Patescibacteria group bacterium]
MNDGALDAPTLKELKTILGAMFEFDRLTHQRLKKWIQERCPNGLFFVGGQQNTSSEDMLFEIQLIDLIAHKMLEKGERAPCCIEELEDIFSCVADYIINRMRENGRAENSFDTTASEFENKNSETELKKFLIETIKESMPTMSMSDEIENVWRDSWKICRLFKEVAVMRNTPLETLIDCPEIEDEVKRKFYFTKEKMWDAFQKKDLFNKIDIKKVVLGLLRVEGLSSDDFEKSEEAQKWFRDIQLIFDRTKREKANFYAEEMKRVWG